MHRLPQRATLYVIPIQCQPHVLPRETRLFRIHRDARQPVIRVKIPSFRLAHHLHPLHPVQQLHVQIMNLPPAGNVLLQHEHLAPPDPRAYITHPVIITDFLVLVMRGLLPRLRGVKQRPFCSFLARANQRPTTGRRDNLVPVKRQRRVHPERPALPPLVL